MAACDYCSCSVCGGKAFYDANVTDARYTRYDDWKGKYLPLEETVLFECVCVGCRNDYEIIVRKRENG